MYALSRLTALGHDYVSLCEQDKLVSVCVCSNIPGFKVATCFVTESREEVIQQVKRFYEYFSAIQQCSEELMTAQFEKVLAQLEVYQKRVDKVEEDYKKDEVFSKLCGFKEKNLCQLH